MLVLSIGKSYIERYDFDQLMPIMYIAQCCENISIILCPRYDCVKQHKAVIYTERSLIITFTNFLFS